MALLKIETLDTDVRLGLWKIEEQEEDLIRDYSWLSDITERLKVVRSAQRRLEVLAIYALLYELTSDKALRITHDLYGCPHVLDYYIGISQVVLPINLYVMTSLLPLLLTSLLIGVQKKPFINTFQSNS